MSDKNTSTLQSYVDAATGMMQKTVGTVIGNKSDEVRPWCGLATTLNRKLHQFPA